MKRLSIFIYGALCYAATLVTFAYTFLFLGNLGLPRTLDSEGSATLPGALLIDVALVVLFGLQHSLMARPGFKRRWTRIVPEAAERSTYMLFSCVALLALFIAWQPLGGTVWEASTPLARRLIYGLYSLGWVILLLASFLINHFDLFGLRQVWLQLRGQSYRPLPFGTPLLYRVVRHPIYVGWLLIFWAAPTMTAAHLVFALATSAYILVAIRLEERDLIEAHPEYANYRERVPMLVPSLRRPTADTTRVATGV